MLQIHECVLKQILSTINTERISLHRSACSINAIAAVLYAQQLKIQSQSSIHIRAWAYTLGRHGQPNSSQKPKREYSIYMPLLLTSFLCVCLIPYRHLSPRSLLVQNGSLKRLHMFE